MTSGTSLAALKQTPTAGGHRLDPWVGELRSHAVQGRGKKKNVDFGAGGSGFTSQHRL